MPKGQTIEVYLETEMNLSHQVNVFGEGGPIVEQVVDCGSIPVTVMYVDISQGVFEVFEDTDRNDIVGDLISRDLDHGLTDTESAFTDAINNRLSGVDAPGVKLETVDALPFSAYSAGDYTQYASVGELALGWIAFHLFGHVQATAAITNDQAIVDDVNDAVTDGATGLIALLLAKNQALITEVVKHVVGQDPERLKDNDNNKATPDRRIALAFYADDVIYFKVNMSGWSASYSSATNSSEAGVLGGRITTAEGGSSNHFYLKFTLAA